MLDVEALRREIPSLGRAVYLNTGGVGPMTRPVYELLMREFTERYLNGSPLNMRPQSYQMEKDRARQTMAGLLGVEAGEVCFTRGVSDGANIVIKGLDWRAGDEIIITDEENPAFLLPALALKASQGVAVRTLNLDNRADVILERFQALLTPRTRLVAISHVTTDNGVLLPVQEMCVLAHRRGAPVFLDGAQAVGRFPFDLKRMGCDFYGLLSYKWLLGPYTAGVLYVAKERLDSLQVTLLGERAEKRIDRAAGTYELLDTVQRFEYGPHGWPLYFGMAEAARYLQSLGLAQIDAQARAQANYLKQGLESIPGVAIVSPQDPASSTSIVTFTLEQRTGREVALALRNTWNIITRSTGIRFDALRVSVAFFTTCEELDALLEAVSSIAAGHCA